VTGVIASKSFVHVNLHAQNMHKSYMHNSPLSEIKAAGFPPKG
jgi:hypothetical protein